jgi:hypothetical protein
MIDKKSGDLKKGGEVDGCWSWRPGRRWMMAKWDEKKM